MLGMVHPRIILALEGLRQENGELEARESHMKDSVSPTGQSETIVTMSNPAGVAFRWADTKRIVETISKCSTPRGRVHEQAGRILLNLHTDNE